MFLHLSVSHFVHRRGVCLSACWDTPGQTHPPDQCMLVYTVPSACWDTQCPLRAGIDMATAADGTHPTGMHSCFNVQFFSSGSDSFSRSHCK